MTATKDVDMVLANQGLPPEFIRLGSVHTEREEPEVATMLSGVKSERRPDGVICRLMLRRNLLVPAHDGMMAQSAWRIA
jgi:hypothetical protein